ncbi:hypothetical protein SAMN05421751_11194 [Jhaorihella thermophila]|uniref:Uncharacterized protein n=1 Tax=Jhaorihella thermophila TaxID=488547 RepID=A0A1H5XKJ2_9RHOB|nr:hypothetical protein SAMN05421751_11194 [Jhaorihella thermophila]
MSGAVVVQVLFGEGPPRGGDRLRAGHVAIHQEGAMVRVRPEGFQDVFAAVDHLVIIVGSDVPGKQLCLPGFVLRALHRVMDQPHGFLERRKHLIALGLVVLDEIAAQPEFIAGIGKGFRAQAQFRLDDGADDEAAIHHRPAQHAPQVGNCGRRPVEQTQIGRRDVEIVHLGIGHVAHALVVADRKRQEAGDHRAPVDHVAVEQLDRVGDLHQLLFRVDLVDQRIDAFGEIVGCGHLDIGAGRAFGGEVGGGFEIAIAFFMI